MSRYPAPGCGQVVVYRQRLWWRGKELRPLISSGRQTKVRIAYVLVRMAEVPKQERGGQRYVLIKYVWC